MARPQGLVAINSDANINVDRLRHIAERTEIGEHREALLGKRSITEFNYRYSDPRAAQILAAVQLSEGDLEKHQIIAMLKEQG